MEALPSRIRELMKKHELLTEKELSAATGVPQPTINRILNGNTKVPRKAALKAFSTFFRVPLHAFLESGNGEQEMDETLTELGTRVPLLGWDDTKEQLSNFTDSTKISYEHVITFRKLEGELFALVAQGSELEHIFPKGTVLIFRADKQPKNRDYILLDYEDGPTLKQILIDGRDKYTKSLDAALKFPVTKLEPDDDVMGVLVQSISEYGN